METKGIILFITAGERGEDRETVAVLHRAGYTVVEAGAFSLRLAERAGLAELALVAAPEDPEILPETLRHMQGILPLLPRLVLSVRTSSRLIIDCFRAGTSDFFEYPIPYDDLLARIAGLLEARQQPSGSSARGKATADGPRLIGESRAMQLIRKRLEQVAVTDATVLITGETGTGKDLAGLSIHRQSRRCRHPYIAVNCAALPEGLVESELFGYEKGSFTGAEAGKKGKFELADGGTLFLDEIGEMPLQLQAKLLYAIEKKSVYRVGGRRAIPVDVKIVAATNKDIKRAVETGEFRIDLYYRLNIAYVEMPPLRRRKEDLELLVDHFSRQTATRYGKKGLHYSAGDLALLHRYEWPGNVRELQNIIEMSFINQVGGQNRTLELPREFRQCIDGGERFDERRLLVSALLANNWNKTKTAADLNWSRMTVYRKIHKYNIIEKRERDDHGDK